MPRFDISMLPTPSAFTASPAPRPRWRDWKVPANLVTALRIILLPPLAWAVAQGWFRLAIPLLAVAAGSDALDGWLARHRGQATALGFYLDPIADKLLAASLFLGLTLRRFMPPLLSVLVFTRDASIVMLAVMLFGKAGFGDFRPTRWGKLTTLTELLTLGLTIVNAVGNPLQPWLITRLLWLATFFMVFGSGTHYALLCSRRYWEWKAGAQPPDALEPNLPNSSASD